MTKKGVFEYAKEKGVLAEFEEILEPTAEFA
jgi:hypothetical protein